VFPAVPSGILFSELDKQSIRHCMLSVQASVTDDIPLHVLGGNIVPMAMGSQFMLTQDVRNSSLALVVAFPAENSTTTGAQSPQSRPFFLLSRRMAFSCASLLC
jgi:hypothetical protein